MNLTPHQKIIYTGLRDWFLSLLTIAAISYLFWLFLPYIGLFRSLFIK